MELVELGKLARIKYITKFLISWLYIVPLTLTICLLVIYTFSVTQAIYVKLVHNVDGWPKEDGSLYPLLFIYGVVFYLCSRIGIRSYLRALSVALVCLFFWGAINRILYDSIIPIQEAKAPTVLFVLNCIALSISVFIFVIRTPEFYLSQKLGIKQRNNSLRTGLLLYLGFDLYNPQTLKYLLTSFFKGVAIVTVISIVYFYIGTAFYHFYSNSITWVDIISFFHIEGEIAFAFILIVIPSVFYLTFVRRETYLLIFLLLIWTLVFTVAMMNYHARVSDETSVTTATIGAILATICMLGAISLDIITREKEKLLAHSARTATETISIITSSAPALFLRSFKDDGHVIWSTRIFRRLGTFTKTRYLAGQTIEQLMFYKCMWNFPIIALKNPHLHHVSNIAVDNATEENWQSKISNHMHFVNFIFLFLGNTNNVRWELDRILEFHTQKLILVFPPDYQADFFLVDSFPALAKKFNIDDKEAETTFFKTAKIIVFNNDGSSIIVFKSTHSNVMDYEIALEAALSRKISMKN